MNTDASTDGGTDELRDYLYREMAKHFHRLVRKGRAGAAGRLFALVEKPGFLAAQAAATRGFETTSEDLELRALPAAIAAGEWERFLHYALLALNLRGLSAALARPAILQALARADRLELAEDALGRIPDPAARAAARAHLAAACIGKAGEKGERFRAQLARIDEDLEAWSYADSGELPVAELAAVARRLAPDLAGRWPVWLTRAQGDPGATQTLAWAVAEGYLAQKKTDDDGLWQALATADRPAVLAALPERLGALDVTDLGAILSRLAALLGPEDSWPAAARFLSCQAERHPDRALAAWDTPAAPVPWSAALAEAGWGFFRRFSPERLEGLATAATDPETRTALSILALAAAPAPARIAAALEAVEALENGPRRLHWALRYLESRPPDADALRQFGAVLAYLRELRYEADPADVARFLDLAAHALPAKALAREIEDAVFSPASNPETLRLLSARVTAPPVLAEIQQRAERFAAAVAPTEAEGFLLRGELIQSTTRRLCRACRDLRFFDAAVEKLLPDEEDALRAALAADFAESAPELARQAASPIRTADRRLESALPVSSATEIDGLLGDPAKRYETLATVGAVGVVEGELLALRALLETPYDPLALAERWINPIRDRDTQTRGLLRLAWHALAYEREFHHGRQDRAAALEVVRASLAVADDDKLAALTPEIAALGAQRRGRYAVAEFQEAARRLLALTGVPWPQRLAALSDLLSRLGPVFLPEGGDGRRACRRIAEVLRAALRLADDLEPAAAREELRAHWNEILPILAHAAGGLPAFVTERLAAIATLPPGWERIPAPAAPASPVEETDGADWLQRFARRVGQDGVEPNDPAVQPSIERLWTCDPAASRPPLATAALLALRTGSQERGQAAVRLWLHAHLAPRPGFEQAGRAALAAAAEKALAQARTLPASESPTA